MPYPASARTVAKRTSAAIRRSSSASAISDLARAERYSTGTPARSNRASSPVQASGRNSRRPTITGTSPRARVSDTKVWQFAVLPKADAYCGATPTECVPFFGNAVSSMTRKASAPPTSVRLERKLKLQRSLVPDPVRHEMVQPVVIARRDPLGHRADALAIAQPDQPRYIQRTHPPPRLVTEPFHKRPQPPR